MRVVLTCCCGASVEASWEASSYHGEAAPKSLERFERAHKPCVERAQEQSPASAAGERSGDE